MKTTTTTEPNWVAECEKERWQKYTVYAAFLEAKRLVKHNEDKEIIAKIETCLKKDYGIDLNE